MLEYPKIETLYVRDLETHKVIDGELRRPEFAIPRTWHVTEKVDGTNVRLILDNTPSVSYRGRTDAAQMPPFLLDMLQGRFPLPIVAAAFEPLTTAIIFGEGYGPRIQKGGGNYTSIVSFRVFDVAVLGDDNRWRWLSWGGVTDIARKIGADTVPVLYESATLQQALSLVVVGSHVARVENSSAPTIVQEGIVARTDPLLFMGDGRRLTFKLKGRDFA